MPWPGDTSRVPKATLEALDFELATHKVYESSGRTWVVIAGVRGGDPLVVSDTIPAWGVQLIGELAEQLCASETHVAQDTQFCVEPIIDVRTHGPARAQLLLPDSRAETLRAAMQHVAQWRSNASFRAAHIGVDADDHAAVQRYVDAIRESEAGLRGMLAIDLHTNTAGSAGVRAALATFGQCGVEAGVALDDITIRDIARLAIAPIAFVKLPRTHETLRLSRALPWPVFAVNCEEPPPWAVFAHHNVHYAQGLAIQPPMPVHEYERWMRPRTRSGAGR